jgi:hypothetical protein
VYLIRYINFSNSVRDFQVLMAARIKMRALWDIVPCILVGLDRRFRFAYCLHHQASETSSIPMRLHDAISQKTLFITQIFSSMLQNSLGMKVSLPVTYQAKYMFRVFLKVSSRPRKFVYLKRRSSIP